MGLKICLPLCHQISESGELSQDAKLRIERASSLFFSEECDYLLTTGWRNQSKFTNTIADFVAEQAINNYKVPVDKILRETRSKDTVGEAIFSNLLINDISDSQDLTIFVVTSNWHLARAKEIFKFIYSKTNIKLLFFSVKGRKTEEKKELKNKSIEEFRCMIRDCKPGDTLKLLELIQTKHKLYS